MPCMNPARRWRPGWDYEVEPHPEPPMWHDYAFKFSKHPVLGKMFDHIHTNAAYLYDNNGQLTAKVVQIADLHHLVQTQQAMIDRQKISWPSAWTTKPKSSIYDSRVDDGSKGVPRVQESNGELPEMDVLFTSDYAPHVEWIDHKDFHPSAAQGHAESARISHNGPFCVKNVPDIAQQGDELAKAMAAEDAVGRGWNARLRDIQLWREGRDAVNGKLARPTEQIQYTPTKFISLPQPVAPVQPTPLSQLRPKAVLPEPKVAGLKSKPAAIPTLPPAPQASAPTLAPATPTIVVTPANGVAAASAPPVSAAPKPAPVSQLVPALAKPAAANATPSVHAPKLESPASVARAPSLVNKHTEAAKAPTKIHSPKPSRMTGSVLDKLEADVASKISPVLPPIAPVSTPGEPEAAVIPATVASPIVTAPVSSSSSSTLSAAVSSTAPVVISPAGTASASSSPPIASPVALPPAVTLPALPIPVAAVHPLLVAPTAGTPAVIAPSASTPALFAPAACAPSPPVLLNNATVGSSLGRLTPTPSPAQPNAEELAIALRVAEGQMSADVASATPAFQSSVANVTEDLVQEGQTKPIVASTSVIEKTDKILSEEPQQEGQMNTIVASQSSSTTPVVAAPLIPAASSIFALVAKEGLTSKPAAFPVSKATATAPKSFVPFKVTSTTAEAPAQPPLPPITPVPFAIKPFVLTPIKLESKPEDNVAKTTGQPPTSFFPITVSSVLPVPSTTSASSATPAMPKPPTTPVPFAVTPIKLDANATAHVSEAPLPRNARGAAHRKVNSNGHRSAAKIGNAGASGPLTSSAASLFGDVSTPAQVQRTKSPFSLFKKPELPAAVPPSTDTTAGVPTTVGSTATAESNAQDKTSHATSAFEGIELFPTGMVLGSEKTAPKTTTELCAVPAVEAQVKPALSGGLSLLARMGPPPVTAPPPPNHLLFGNIASQRAAMPSTPSTGVPSLLSRMGPPPIQPPASEDEEWEDDDGDDGLDGDEDMVDAEETEAEENFEDDDDGLDRDVVMGDGDDSPSPELPRMSSAAASLFARLGPRVTTPLNTLEEESETEQSPPTQRPSAPIPNASAHRSPPQSPVTPEAPRRPRAGGAPPMLESPEAHFAASPTPVKDEDAALLAALGSLSISKGGANVPKSASALTAATAATPTPAAKVRTGKHPDDMTPDERRANRNKKKNQARRAALERKAAAQAAEDAEDATAVEAVDAMLDSPAPATSTAPTPPESNLGSAFGTPERTTTTASQSTTPSKARPVTPKTTRARGPLHARKQVPYKFSTISKNPFAVLSGPTSNSSTRRGQSASSGPSTSSAPSTSGAALTTATPEPGWTVAGGHRRPRRKQGGQV